jgi:hypothetical protein
MLEFYKKYSMISINDLKNIMTVTFTIIDNNCKSNN